MGIPSLKTVLVEMEQRVQEQRFELLKGLYKKASIIHTASVSYLEEEV